MTMEVCTVHGAGYEDELLVVECSIILRPEAGKLFRTGLYDQMLVEAQMGQTGQSISRSGWRDGAAPQGTQGPSRSCALAVEAGVRWNRHLGA